MFRSNKMSITSIPESYRSRFPNIPNQLFTYLDHLLKRQTTSSQFHTAMINHPDNTFKVLDFQFRSGSEIVSLSPNDLLKRLDFKQKDLSPERIESLLGELRTIHFLHHNGFTNINPICANSKRSPDFFAKRNGIEFQIEVATSIHSSRRMFHDSIVKWATHKLKNDDKLSQMDSETSTTRMMFVCILNSSYAVALNERSDYLNMIKDVWKAIGSIPNLHIAIVTGRISLKEGMDDCIYPSIDTL